MIVIVSVVVVSVVIVIARGEATGMSGEGGAMFILSVVVIAAQHLHYCEALTGVVIAVSGGSVGVTGDCAQVLQGVGQRLLGSAVLLAAQLWGESVLKRVRIRSSIQGHKHREWINH